MYTSYAFEELNEHIEDGFDCIQTLQNAADYVGDKNRKDELISSKERELLDVTLEHVSRQLGMSRQEVPALSIVSMESWPISRQGAMKQQVAMESGIIEFIGKVFKAIINFVKRLFGFVTSSTSSSSCAAQKKRIEHIKTEYVAMEKPHKNGKTPREIEHDGLARYFSDISPEDLLNNTKMFSDIVFKVLGEMRHESHDKMDPEKMMTDLKTTLGRTVKAMIDEGPIKNSEELVDNSDDAKFAKEYTDRLVRVKGRGKLLFPGVTGVERDAIRVERHTFLHHELVVPRLAHASSSAESKTGGMVKLLDSRDSNRIIGVLSELVHDKENSDLAKFVSKFQDSAEKCEKELAGMASKSDKASSDTMKAAKAHDQAGGDIRDTTLMVVMSEIIKYQMARIRMFSAWLHVFSATVHQIDTTINSVCRLMELSEQATKNAA